MGHLREVYGAPDEKTLGEIEVTEVDLPAGPALRFHRHWAQKPDQLGRSIEREDVIYAVRPPQIRDAVVLVVSWVELALGPALIKTADAVAKTLTIKPLDDHPLRRHIRHPALDPVTSELLGSRRCAAH